MALSVPWSLRPRNRAAAATCGRGRCEIPAILRVIPKIASDCNFVAAGEAKSPAISAAEWLGSPLAATVVIMIWRCEFCAAEVWQILVGDGRGAYYRA